MTGRLVARFLREDIAPLVAGSHRFQAARGANALEMMARQLTLEAASDRRGSGDALSETARALQGSLCELNPELSGRIAQGRSEPATPGLADHLWATTLAKLAVDQPTLLRLPRRPGRDRGAAAP